jgi:hypothetical protein
MSWQLLFTLLAASMGLVSGGWLCYPTATSSPHALAWIANPPWESGAGMARLLLEQSAQYWVGGGLLAFAFLAQVAAALSSATVGPLGSASSGRPMFWNSMGALAVFLLCVGLTSGVAYQWRKANLEAAMRDAAAELKAHPRLTPEP